MARYVDFIGWDDCPHLKPPFISEQELKDFEGEIDHHQLKARKYGYPSIGPGAIYPVDEDSLFIDPIELPAHWPRAYAMDPGWKRTAAIWGAMDPEPEEPIFYLYSEYYESRKSIPDHVHAIQTRGRWITGAFDSANPTDQSDGAQLREEYEDMGLHLVDANKKVQAGIHHCLMLMQSGRLKIFRTLSNTRKELKLYRRNEKGKIVKENDHLMDAMRYLLFTEDIFKTEVRKKADIMSHRTGEF